MKMVLLAVVVVLVLTGCPGGLVTTMPSDVVLVLGDASGQTDSTIHGVSPGMAYIAIRATDTNRINEEGSWDLVYHLSVDADLETLGDNYLLDNDHSIAPGEEKIFKVSLQTAENTTFGPGLYTLFVTVAANDDIAGNNTHSIPLEIGILGSPDLELTVTSTPALVIPGEEYRIYYKLANTGYDIVPDGTPTTVMVQTLIGGITVDLGHDDFIYEQPFLPGQSLERYVVVPMSSTAEIAAFIGVSENDLGVWDQSVSVLTDHWNQVVEVVEGDTKTFNTRVIGNAYPEFAVDQVTVEGWEVGGNAIIGRAADFTVTLRNDGYTASGDYELFIFVDTDWNGYDDGDVVILDWSEAETPPVPVDLSGGGRNTVTISGTQLGLLWPLALPPGWENLRVMLTATGPTISAPAATGNSGATFLAEDLNLRVKTLAGSVTGPIDSAAGGTIPLTYTIQNDGDNDVTTDFIVSFSGTHDNGGPDIDLGDDLITSTIPAHSQITETYGAIFSAGTADGFYTITLDIDSGDAVAETNEGDNTPDEASVFVMVSDGDATFNAKILVCKPYGNPDEKSQVGIRTYPTLWNNTSVLNFYLYEDGSFYCSPWSYPLESGEYGLRFENTYSNPAPLAYRLVPGNLYTANIPAYIIPSWPEPDDRITEPNDSTNRSFALPDSMNPLYGWVPLSLKGEDLIDYISFIVP